MLVFTRNSVSSSNIIDGGSQFIEKQWEHHIKTNGSKTMAAGVPHTYNGPAVCLCHMLAASFHACGAVKFIDFGFAFYYHCNNVCWHCRHECISLTTMRTWEITQIYYNLPCYKCWCEWVPDSESLLLLDNETLECIFSVMNICLVREFSDL